MKVSVCMGTTCMMNGAQRLYDQLTSLNEIISLNPEDYTVEELVVEPVKCQKECKKIENYSNCVVYIDGEQVRDLSKNVIVENIMKQIKK